MINGSLMLLNRLIIGNEPDFGVEISFSFPVFPASRATDNRFNLLVRNILDYTDSWLRASPDVSSNYSRYRPLSTASVPEVSRPFACVIPNVVYVTIISVRKTCGSPARNFVTLN